MTEVTLRLLSHLWPFFAERRIIRWPANSMYLQKVLHSIYMTPSCEKGRNNARCYVVMLGGSKGMI